ncbi:MAG TPA: GNAT family N-acetyltransferase [Dehalococcoidia bacterium]|nr:GNAT family N-acetyltransferase [Dehalococcoidia bacterium]
MPHDPRPVQEPSTLAAAELERARAVAKDSNIQGEKVTLRPKRLDDAPRDYAWRCDEEMARYDGVPPLRISLQDFLNTHAEELRYPSPHRQVYAIEDGQGRHIGNIMYYDLDLARGEAELGIAIGDRGYWGRGYGTDAVITFVRHLFTRMPLRRIFLNTLDWNVRAQRAFAKAGFTACGRVFRNGNTFITMELHPERLQEQAPPDGQDRHGGSEANGQGQRPLSSASGGS